MIEGATLLSPELLAPTDPGNVSAQLNTWITHGNAVVKCAGRVSAIRASVHGSADTAAIWELNHSVVGESCEADILVILG